MLPVVRAVLGSLALVGALATAAGAQAIPDSGQASPSVAQAWQWSVDGSVFFGFNYQHRKFRDFSAWESQNWLMAGGARRVRSGTFTASTMLSLEPWTIKDIGSPQAFQTGETFRRAPLIDYQHPHDLIMGLGATYRVPWRRVTWHLAGAVVGAPAFGPAAFMHRPSATDNPQVPLSHHQLDSTHITPGVVTVGATAAEWTLQGSWFKGREPDENRTDLDLGALDSYSIRLGWTRGAWSAQASGAALTTPELLAPYDAKRLSASVSYDEPAQSRVAWTVAFGQNREIHGNLEAYLLEGRMQIRPRDAVYARAESAAKSILDAGFHPPGVFHRHRQSQVGAFTIGYIRDLWTVNNSRLGIGGDVTGYLVPDNLRDAYGSPVSFHIFLRYRPGRGDHPGVTHVH
jgi:hypothetical protein